jgi:hypothetical protein
MKVVLLLGALVGLAACERSRLPEPGKPDAAATGTTLTTSTATSADSVAAPPIATTFSFDADAPGEPPKGFVFGRTGGGRAGRWLVQADTAARSAPRLLAQVDSDDTNFRFPVALAPESQRRDVRVSVSCRMVSGRVDQACGLVLRYRDENNYLITRANALEDNIRLYAVKDGKRDELASHDIEVAPHVWYDYRFEARGEKLRVWWDGKLVLEHRDKTFVGAGSVGVWTKADSVTHFDDLIVEPLQ